MSVRCFDQTLLRCFDQESVRCFDRTLLRICVRSDSLTLPFGFSFSICLIIGARQSVFESPLTAEFMRASVDAVTAHDTERSKKEMRKSCTSSLTDTEERLQAQNKIILARSKRIASRPKDPEKKLLLRQVNFRSPFSDYVNMAQLHSVCKSKKAFE